MPCLVEPYCLSLRRASSSASSSRCHGSSREARSLTSRFSGEMGPQRLDLRQEIFAVQRHAVAEDVHDPFVENAGGQQVQGKLAHVVDDGVAGVAATLIPDHDVKPLG